MANFELAKNLLEGILNNQINAARQTQGVWEWFNALYKVISSVRYSGTVTIFGPKQLASGTNVVETVAVTLFGVLADNSMAAEPLLLQFSNVAATPGTTDILGALFVPSSAVRMYVWPEGQVHSARLEVFSTQSTNAGLEAGTASTTQPTVVLVYTK
jgi:hypothetical protein